MKKISLVVCAIGLNLFSNPYPDPKKVPVDPPYIPKIKTHTKLSIQKLKEQGAEVIRVDVRWTPNPETYILDRVALEVSGTEALAKRSQHVPQFGSYIGTLKSSKTGRVLAYDSVGTGMEYRLLTRGMTFRFPTTLEKVEFSLTAENPQTGKMEEVLKSVIDPTTLPALTAGTADVRQLKKASQLPLIRLNVYADGYVPAKGGTADVFFKDAQHVVDALQQNNFPEYDRFEMVAVYQPSKTQLGKAKDLGTPVPVRDSFLGLYYPYWDDFGRWYNIVYPTSEKKLRDGLGIIPYDYAFILVDNSEYWGIGNFNVFTAIPSRHPSFTYLLTHEFGHFFGLNEEYESGGKTELAFAPEMQEPWSQNITFHPKKEDLKWAQFVESSTSLPTPSSSWHSNGPWGAYKGGYAQTEPMGKSHKPGLSCIMKSDTKFCPICKDAITKKIQFDAGM